MKIVTNISNLILIYHDLGTHYLLNGCEITLMKVIRLQFNNNIR